MRVKLSAACRCPSSSQSGERNLLDEEGEGSPNDEKGPRGDVTPALVSPPFSSMLVICGSGQHAYSVRPQTIILTLDADSSRKMRVHGIIIASACWKPAMLKILYD